MADIPEKNMGAIGSLTALLMILQMEPTLEELELTIKGAIEKLKSGEEE